MKTLKFALPLLALCVGCFRVAQAQNGDLKITEAKTENKDGCVVITMIPGFDIDTEAGEFNGGFHLKGKKTGLSLKQGLSGNSGTWVLKKCPCPDNLQEFKKYSAEITGVELQLQGDIKNPWLVKASGNTDIFIFNVDASAWAGVDPTVGGGIKNLNTKYTRNDCVAPPEKQLSIDGTANAFVQLRVGGGASLDLVFHVFGEEDIKIFGAKGAFVYVDSQKVESTATFNYQGSANLGGVKL